MFDGCSIGKRGLLAWKVLLAITIQKKVLLEIIKISKPSEWSDLAEIQLKRTATFLL